MSPDDFRALGDGRLTCPHASRRPGVALSRTSVSGSPASASLTSPTELAAATASSTAMPNGSRQPPPNSARAVPAAPAAASVRDQRSAGRRQWTRAAVFRVRGVRSAGRMLPAAPSGTAAPAREPGSASPRALRRGSRRASRGPAAASCTVRFGQQHRLLRDGPAADDRGHRGGGRVARRLERRAPQQRQRRQPGAGRRRRAPPVPVP